MSAKGDEELQLVTVDRTKCDNCGKCAEACTAKALYMCGDDYTVEEVMERIRRDVPFYERSGGGVTISGGECLCQPEFLLAVLKQCKAEGIHTAVDTTGFAPWSSIEPILPYTDLFLYDLKNMDSAAHKAVIGVPNELILENARKIAAAGGKFQIRIPIIPMFLTTPRSRLKRWVSSSVNLATLLRSFSFCPTTNWEPLSGSASRGITRYLKLNRQRTNSCRREKSSLRRWALKL